ncbi:MAG: hypothetical protein GY940_03620, partial [bacterium]|nr:hypothetical protein [bacterium]
MSIKKVILMLSLALIACRLFSAELPKPNYDNSIPFSMTYSLLSDPTEIQYIKDQFGGGLYAPLSFSIFNGVSMSWTLNPANANSGITQFKNTVDQLVAKAKFYGVGFHIVVYYGMSRGHNYYTDAKNEDIRNAQWYNDNNLATQAQMKTSSTSAAAGEYGGDGYDFLFDGKSEYLLDEMLSTDSGDSPSTNQYVFSTPSRYARKLRKHLEAKVKAAMDYLKLKQDQNPNMLIIASGPGEAELNSLRIQSGSPLPDYFCDYSPFTILEFRDWIRHTGMYAPSGEYSGQGYAGGGNRYLGSQGLTNFNADFNTSFSSWGLKYYHWNLSDPVDIDYSDSVNPDSRIIPVSSYKFDGMMPTSGQFYINGGFDPPRVMKKKGQNTYWDLWQTFRETMIHHYVKDVVSIVKDSGFDKDRYFTHQIPGDYLFGTRPNDPAIPNLNKRYYTSASPLWTADAGSVLDVGMGITSYDINFGTWYARTSEYVFSAIAAMSNNWGVLEYNPEITATGVTINTVQAIYERMIKLYNEGPHFIGFYKWESNADRIYKGTNREYAAKKFFDVIKDKARQDISRVFIPKALLELKGTASSVTHSIDLSWSQKIWSDLSFQWPDWGDFKEFVIYRGYSANFKTD